LNGPDNTKPATHLYPFLDQHSEISAHRLSAPPPPPSLPGY
jgi:hypothetical protein